MNSLVYHQQELEERIKRFDSICALAINHIRNLKQQARSLSSQLNQEPRPGEPRELKNLFLQCTKQLDEFMYHITEFNLNTSALESKAGHNKHQTSAPTPNFNGQSETLLSDFNIQQLAETNNSRTKQTTKTLKEENWRESSLSDSVEKKEIIRESDEVTVSSTTESKAGHNKHQTSAPTPNFNGQSETLLSDFNIQQLAETNNSRTKQTTKTLKEENWRESSLSDSVEKKEIIRESDEVTVSSTTDCDPPGLPPQPKLDPSVSEAIIISVNGAQLWLLVDYKAFTDLGQAMKEYYTERKQNPDYIPENVCAYYDEETKHFFRALYIDSELGDPEVFLVDTGEFLPAVQNLLHPLHPNFCAIPPLAQLCCLADVDQTEDKNLEGKQTEFLKQFWGKSFKISITMDDSEEYDPSMPVFVYLYLEDGRTINELLVQALASSNPVNPTLAPSVTENEKSKHITQNIHDEDDDIDYESDHVMLDENAGISDEIDFVIRDENARIGEEQDRGLVHKVDNVDLDLELDYSKHPEYENAVEAVTGYSNRDEMDICKHYNGGEGCFKGQRCKKRHVKMHPDGWTLDRVSVAVNCRPAPLPAPGTWHKVKVTHVDSTCRLYVHFEEPEDSMSLADLVDEMTREAADSRPLQLEPAPGELVSARFSDGRYYRARVIPSDEDTEVMYIDYGNTSAFSLSDLRPLESRWLTMPVRAVSCRLAGVSGASENAVTMLKELALDKIMQAKIITRDYDEVSVQLLDSQGFDLAEQLAAFAGVELLPYSVEDDSQRRCCHVPA